MSIHEAPDSKSGTRRILWIDTDVGLDDLVAISSLNGRQDVQISQITIVGGIQSNTMESASFLQTEFFPTIVIPGFVPAAMPNDESASSWLQNTRQQLKSLYSENISSIQSTLETDNGQNQLASFLASQEDHSVDLICLGPLTNIAYCLDNNNLHDLMKGKLRQVWIMGGNNPSLSSEPEFNFAMDPHASASVLKALQDRIYIVPFQTCQVQTNEDATIQATWDRIVYLATTLESSSANKRSSILQRILQTNSDFSAVKYDAICAFAYCRSDVVTTEQIQVRVDSSSGLLELALEEDLKEHRLVTGFPLTGESGFFHWLQEAIETR